MADIAISYSHRDSDIAGRLEYELTAAGRTVWLDDPRERASYGSGITLPSGQNHWEVISGEFLRADVVVVVATADWAESEYCQREYQFLREWGKWVVFISLPSEPNTRTGTSSGHPTTTLSVLLDQLARNEALASAHARLAVAAHHSDDRPDGSVVERMLRRTESSDARRVLAEASSAPWQPISPSLDAYINRVLKNERRNRRRMRGAGIVVVTILAVLALAGVTAYVAATIARNQAQDAADRAQSISLASQSESVDSTVEAVELAQRAVELHRDSLSLNALAVAKDRDNRLRVVTMSADQYISLVLSPSGRRALAATRDSIRVFDTNTGTTVRQFTGTVGPRFGSMVFSPAGDRIIYVDGNADLVSASIEVGPSRILAQNVQTVGASSSQLWWSISETLYAGDFDGRVHFSARTGTRLAAMSIDDGQRIVDTVGTDGTLSSFSYDDAKLTLNGTREIGGGNRSIRSSVLNSVVKRCGKHVFGVVPNYKLALLATEFHAFEGTIAIKKSTSGAQPPVCLGKDNAWTTDIYGSQEMLNGGARPFFPRVEQRLAIAAGAEGRLYALATSGRLYSMLPTAMATVSDGNGALEIAKLGSTTIGLTADNRVIDASTGRLVASGLGSFYPNTLVQNQTSAAFLSTAGLVIVHESGRVRVITHPLDNLSSLTSTGDGNHYLMSFDRSVTVIDPEGTESNSWNFPWIRDDDTVVSAATSVDGRRLVVSTARGLVGVMAVEAPQSPRFLDQPLPQGRQSRVAFAPSGDLLVSTPQGQLRLISSSMTTKRSIVFGAPAEMLQVDGDRVLVTAGSIGAVVYSLDDLRTVARISSGFASPSTMRLTKSARQITGARISISEDGEISDQTSLVVVPLTSQ